MENASLSSDVWNDVTTSSSKDDDLTLYLASIRYVALKIIYIIIGTVGVLDNVCRRPWQLVRHHCFRLVHQNYRQGISSSLIAYSHRRHGQDKTCLVRDGGVNTIGDKTKQFCLPRPSFLFQIFSSLQYNYLRLNSCKAQLKLETGSRQYKTVLAVLSPILFTLPTRTRQDIIYSSTHKFFLSDGQTQRQKGDSGPNFTFA